MMAKYIDKADIVKLISECMFDLSDSDDLTKMLTEVDELPTVEIINCKDCKWWNKNRIQCDRQVCAVMRENDFCSYRERKDG